MEHKCYSAQSAVWHAPVFLLFLVHGALFSFVSVLVSVFLSVSIFPCFSPSVWGLMAGSPGFAIHGSSLHLGAGCQ